MASINNYIFNFFYVDSCSFAGHFCSWINDNTDDFDWLLHNGSTMTRETGPTTDADGDGKVQCLFMNDM